MNIKAGKFLILLSYYISICVPQKVKGQFLDIITSNSKHELAGAFINITSELIEYEEPQMKFMPTNTVTSSNLRKVNNLIPNEQSYTFSNCPDFEDCPLHLTVILYNVAAKYQGSKSGDYIKNDTQINGRNYWLGPNENAIWFDKTNNNWKIGHIINLGKDISGIISTTNSLCPHQVISGEWMFWNGKLWINALNYIQIEKTPDVEDCPLQLLITLYKDVAAIYKDHFADKYIRNANQQINGRSYWIGLNGNAIWYDKKYFWMVGQVRNIGTTMCFFHLPIASLCPNQPLAEWKFYDKEKWVAAGSNIQIKISKADLSQSLDISFLSL